MRQYVKLTGVEVAIAGKAQELQSLYGTLVCCDLEFDANLIQKLRLSIDRTENELKALLEG